MFVKKSRFLFLTILYPESAFFPYIYSKTCLIIMDIPGLVNFWSNIAIIVSILYGFQAEPTPIGANNLARISILRERTGLNVGFMDHSDGAGDYAFTLSAMALGMDVSLFEKHITLDHALKIEDYVSALPPHDFSRYVKMLSDLSLAQGSSAIELSEAEQVYRSKAVKRVVAAHSLESGKVLTREDIRLSRPAVPGGVYKPEQVINHQIKKPIDEGQPIDMSDLERVSQ